MKHRIKGVKLNRSSNHRKALAKNLVAGLIEHGEIVTTLTKAKLTKRLADKIIGKAIKGDLHSRRQVEAFFNKKSLTNRLVDGIAPELKSRTSGFTRIVRLGERRGDNTMMAKISFTDQTAIVKASENPQKDAKKAKASKPKAKKETQKAATKKSK